VLLTTYNGHTRIRSDINVTSYGLDLKATVKTHELELRLLIRTHSSLGSELAT